LLNFTVVISTYWGESPMNLKAALLSIFQQVLVPSEVVLVVDGPIPEPQQILINELVSNKLYKMSVLYLSENIGRGLARNAGISAAKNSYVALMDSDDICLPNRFLLQVDFMEKNPNVDVLAGLTEEFFDDDSDHSEYIKFSPCEHNEIVSALQISNCIANPTLFFKKECWSRVGGFPDFKLINEDYLFYYRLIAAGAIFASLPQVVLKVRLNAAQQRRRRGFRLLMIDIKFRIIAFKEGHVSFLKSVIVIFLLCVRRLAPPFVGSFMQKIWRKVGRHLFSKK
jgi:glycosyltransferase involved in cell wall biosynthesis